MNYPAVDLWNHPRTPYAVYCHAGHGLVYLTEEQYDVQMEHADDLWSCPVCGHDAGWDDENYEQFQQR